MITRFRAKINHFRYWARRGLLSKSLVFHQEADNITFFRSCELLKTHEDAKVVLLTVKSLDSSPPC
jgi:hypothetical protein